MAKNNYKKTVGIAAAISFLIMLTVNLLAVSLPINGVTPAQISDKYANLFAPAGITFAIWGLIYILLAAYTLYQLGLFPKSDNYEGKLLNKIGVYFSISSLINAAWIFAWHYDRIALSLFLMILLLLFLIRITLLTHKEDLSGKERLFIKLPFSIYFGWITVAAIANCTVFLVSLGWSGGGLSQELWTVFVVIAGLLIALWVMGKNRDAAYGFVIIWAYLGIIIRHLSSKGFAGQYPLIIITCVIALILLLIYIIYIIKKRRTLLPKQ